MSNNIINFFTARNNKHTKNHVDTKKLKVKKIGNINIAVYAEETTKYATYCILPDRKELNPIVDLLDDTLTNQGFEFLEELKVQRL